MKNQTFPPVLYAVDNEGAYFMLSTMLGFSGIDVQAANKTAGALRLAQTECFDSYLLDTRFPKGKGLELCRELREISPQIPIVFYSRDAYTADKASGILAGADAYLVKSDSDTIATTTFRLLNENSKRVFPKPLETIPVMQRLSERAPTKTNMDGFASATGSKYECRHAITVQISVKKQTFKSKRSDEQQKG